MAREHVLERAGERDASFEFDGKHKKVQSTYHSSGHSFRRQIVDCDDKFQQKIHFQSINQSISQTQTNRKKMNQSDTADVTQQFVNATQAGIEGTRQGINI